MNCQSVVDQNPSKSPLPRVGIVIVSWNKKEYLLDLLGSLKTLTYPSASIIVVDNASTDGSSELVREKFPYVILLANTTNLGGTGGFNTGLDYCHEAGFDYIWLLDNDARITPDALFCLVKVAESDSTIGVVGSKILNAEDPAFIVKLGANIDWSKGLVRSVHQNVRNFVDKNEATGVDYVPFCSALIKRKCLMETGRLDERFFLYWDDTDFCIRAHSAGYKTVVATHSVVYHPSFTEKGRGYNYYLTRNTLLFFSKHQKPIARIITLYNVLTRFVKNILFSRLIGDMMGASILTRGLTDFLSWRFGKGPSIHFLEMSRMPRATLLLENQRARKILITYEGTVDAMKSAFMQLPGHLHQEATFLVPFSRADLYANHQGNVMILDDRVRSLFLEHVRIFFKIIQQRFDTVITTHDSMSPFAFACSRTWHFDDKSLTFSEVPINRANLPLLAATIVIGCFLTVLVLPIFWGASILMPHDPGNMD